MHLSSMKRIARVFLGRGRSWQNPEMSMEQTDGYVLDPVFAIKRRFFARAPATEADHRHYGCGRVARRPHAPDRQVPRSRYLQPNLRAGLVACAARISVPRHSGRCGVPLRRTRQSPAVSEHPAASASRASAPECARTVETVGLWHFGRFADRRRFGQRFAGACLGPRTTRRPHLLATARLQGRSCHSEPRAGQLREPLHQQLLRLVEAHSLHTGVDQPGGVFLRKAIKFPEEDLNLILTVAQATLGTIRGQLSKQLSSPPKELLCRRCCRSGKSRNSLLPLYRSWSFRTSTASVDLHVDGREYAIYLGPSEFTPLPWINVMANPVFGALVSESGSGCCWYGNSQSNRLTPWNNDPISDPSTEAIYIRDEDSGVFWTPTPLPVRELDAYRARHGQGYTEFEHNSHALEQTLLTFVPAQQTGWIRSAYNDCESGTDRRGLRRLSVTVLFRACARHGS